MGLLGESWDDPKSNAIMQLAGGLLSGNFGKGVSDYGTVMAAGQDQALKRQLLQSEIELKKLAEQRAQSMFKMQQEAYGSIDGASGPATGASMPAMGAGSTSGGPSAQLPSFGATPNGAPVADQGAQLRQLQKMAIAGVPGAKEMFEIYKYKNDPMKMEQGSTYVNRVTGQREFMAKVDAGMAPDASGTIQALPGYANAQASIEGAKALAVEGAKAGLDLVSVPQSDGTTKMLPRSQAASMLGSPSVAPQAKSIAPGNSGMLDSNPETVRLEQVRIIKSEYDREKNPSVRASLSRELLRLGSPAAASNSPTLGQTQSPVDVGKLKNIVGAGDKVNDTWLKTSYEPVVASGQAAQAVIDNTAIARDAMRKMGGTGWGTETKANAANILTGLGVASDNAKLYATNAQVFQKTAMDRLWTVLNNAKGPQTEGDANRASKTYGQLSNTPQANEFILDLAQAQAERDKAKASFYNNALPIATQNGDLSEVERQWSKRMPSVFDMPVMKKWAK